MSHPVLIRSRPRACSLQAAALLAAFPAFAQDTKPIEWVVGYAAGGGSDIVARTVAEADDASRSGSTIIVNNKPGAATNIAADYVAKSKDVGNVMLTADFATLAANPSLFAKLPYDAEKDFAPVGHARALSAAARRRAERAGEELQGVRRLGQDAARRRELRVGRRRQPAPPGRRTAARAHRAEAAARAVPRRGTRGAGPDGRPDSVRPDGQRERAAVPHVRQAARDRRREPEAAADLPDVPTLAEQGLAGFEAYAWQGLVVPAATPPETVARLNKALEDALDSTSVKARFQTLSLEALPGTPQQMAAVHESERERWGKLIRDNGIKLD